MKRRVVLLVLAVSSLILISFIVPLALLLRQFTADRAVSAATIRAQFMAELVATVGTPDLRLSVARDAAVHPAEPITIFLPDGQRLGAPAPWSSGVQLARSGHSFTEQVTGGVAVLVSVQGLRGGTAIVRAYIPDSTLQAGVTRAWILLGGIGIALLAMAALIAAQLSRSLVRPLAAAARAAEELASGDLTARAPVDGPAEIRLVSNGLNRLAIRIGELLAHERETLADLSHRLRTPLTALRIDAESIHGDHEAMLRVVGDVDALTRTVNEIIAEARRPVAAGGRAVCDAASVVRARAAFWQALAEDQQRWMTVDIPPYHLPVRVMAEDLAACADILLENVFAHTPDGTAFAVRVSERAGGGAWLVVSDNGPGFFHSEPSRRGESTGGSTGLGLDIARRIAEASGGTLTIGRSPHGGGAITIGFGGAAGSVRRQGHGRARRRFRTGPAAEEIQINEELDKWDNIAGRQPGPRPLSADSPLSILDELDNRHPQEAPRAW